MNHTKKINFIIFFTIFTMHHHVHAINTKITCIFNNTTDVPVIFKSFQDNNSRPVETKKLNPNEFFTSNVTISNTVTYDIQPNIETLAYPFMLNGAYNIVFNTPAYPYKFSLIKGSFTNPDPASQNAILATTQITNKTTFPINASIVLKDMGYSNNFVNQPYQSTSTTKLPFNIFQAVNTTKLPVNGFYAITDTIEKLTIASGIQGYNSGPLSSVSIKSRCDIVNHHGFIKTYMTN